MEKPEVLRALVPARWLWLVICFACSSAGAIFGAGIYFASKDAKTEAAERKAQFAIDQLQYRNAMDEKILDYLRSIDRRLSYIEGKLERR